MLQPTISSNPPKARLQVLFILVFISHPSFTQQALQIDLEGVKKSLQYERESIFINALDLSVSQAAVFHPIYVEYNNEKRVLDELLIKLFIEYTQNYKKLDHKLMRNFIKLSKEHSVKEARVRKKYYRKLDNAISTELASQFYEVDDFISTTLRLSILSGLPFMGSIVKLEHN